MFFRILKITFFLALVCSIPSLAQTQDEAKKQQEEFEKKVKEKLEEGIQTFVSQLDVDDFQKEIIKQKLHSYYMEQKEIYTNTSLKYYERDEQLSRLKNSHFDDIKSMISDETMGQIDLFIKDVGQTLEKEKKKKTKNKKKNKKNKDE